MPEPMPDPEIIALLKEAQPDPDKRERAFVELDHYRTEALTIAHSTLMLPEKEMRIDAARDRLRERLKGLLGR